MSSTPPPSPNSVQEETHSHHSPKVTMDPVRCRLLSSEAVWVGRNENPLYTMTDANPFILGQDVLGGSGDDGECHSEVSSISNDSYARYWKAQQQAIPLTDQPPPMEITVSGSPISRYSEVPEWLQDLEDGEFTGELESPCSKQQHEEWGEGIPKFALPPELPRLTVNRSEEENEGPIMCPPLAPTNRLSPLRFASPDSRCLRKMTVPTKPPLSSLTVDTTSRTASITSRDRSTELVEKRPPRMSRRDKSSATVLSIGSIVGVSSYKLSTTPNGSLSSPSPAVASPAAVYDCPLEGDEGELDCEFENLKSPRRSFLKTELQLLAGRVTRPFHRRTKSAAAAVHLRRASGQMA